jgi:hypothetical protein
MADAKEKAYWDHGAEPEGRLENCKYFAREFFTKFFTEFFTDTI